MTKAMPFSAFARLLHWGMAAMIFAMLFIGVSMVVSVTHYAQLVAIHRPLGIAILTLAAIRLIYRIICPPPALPVKMPIWQKIAAHASHWLLYALMFALPLVGWSMLSAAKYPIILWTGWHLPPIVSANPLLAAELRTLHSILAYLLFSVVMAHMAAAFMHALVFKDGVFESMARWRK